MAKAKKFAELSVNDAKELLRQFNEKLVKFRITMDTALVSNHEGGLVGLQRDVRMLRRLIACKGKGENK